MSISIIIADDHKVLRDGIRAAFDRESDFDVVAEASDGPEALTLVKELSPALLLLDLSMPGLPGLEVVRRVVSSSCETKIIVLTMHSDEDYAAKALHYGASAFVIKTAGMETLKKGIQVVLDGGSFVSPPLPEYLIEDVSDPPKRQTNLYDSLTNREREVFHLMADGLTNRGIASRLSITTHTVEVHRSSLMIKLRLRSKAELIRYALRKQAQMAGM